MSCASKNLETIPTSKPLWLGLRLKAFARSAISCVWPIREAYDVVRIFLAVVLLLCPLLQACSHAEIGDSRVDDPLVIKPKTLDFGRVNDATGPLELSFTIANRGDQPIEITDARSGCGCTVAKLSKSVVPPRDHVTATVKVNILGRLGKFDNYVLLDVSGRAEPIAVPIQATIIQDLWFNGPMIQCFATDSESTVEKTFEVHTVDWPSVRFDWKVLDKAISIEELSRSKTADETVIKFRLRMDTPTAQSTNIWHVILVPLDKRIKPLTIPVVWYQPSLRKKEPSLGGNESVHVLRPDRISLGVILRGEERRFDVSGPAKLVNSLKIAGLDSLPEGTKVELHPMNNPKKDLLSITIHVAESAPWGLLDGRIRLKSPDGDEYFIEVLGIMGPRGDGYKPNEAKHDRG
jgi:hypothetical protein